MIFGKKVILIEHQMLTVGEFNININGAYDNVKTFPLEVKKGRKLFVSVKSDNGVDVTSQLVTSGSDYVYSMPDIATDHVIEVSEAAPPTPSGKLYTKRNGAWVEVAQVYVKQNGAWTPAKLHYKENGNWTTT